MRAVSTNLVVAVLLLCSAAAQAPARPARVENITYARQGNDLRIEVTLSAPVVPASETAVHPDRILLDLPGAICTGHIKTLAVGSDGVRRVRTAQHSTDPNITRVVLDLDQAHPYTVQSEGNRVIVTVAPAMGVARSGAPVAAKSGSLIGIFRRKPRTPEVNAEENAPKPASEPPAATAKRVPIIPPSLTSPTPWFPSAHADTQSSSEPAATSAPFSASSTAEKTPPAGSVAQGSFPQVQVATSTSGNTVAKPVPAEASSASPPATQPPASTSAVNLEATVPAPASSTVPAADDVAGNTNTATPGPSSAASSTAPPTAPNPTPDAANADNCGGTAGAAVCRYPDAFGHCAI